MKFNPMKTLANMKRENSTDELPNFWEIGAYKISLNRLESSPELMNDLRAMLNEMIEQEGRTAKFYTDLSQKWKAHFTTGKKLYEGNLALYQSSRDSIMGMLDVLDQFGQLHVNTWLRIQSLCVIPINKYLEENCQPAQLVKTVKSIKQEFEAAQEPYIENANNYKKAKAQYLQYCNGLKPGYNITDPENVFSDVDDKKKTKRLKLKGRYDEWNDQLTNMIDRYTLKMKGTFQKCDDLETVKFETFKTALEGLCEVYSFKTSPGNEEFLEQLKKVVSALDIKSDMDWWRKNYGPDASFDFYQMSGNRASASYQGSIVEDGSIDQKENIGNSIERTSSKLSK